MSCSRYNFTINKGATKVVNVQYTDSTGSIKDITGYEARMQLRPDPESSVVALSLNSTGSTANKSTIDVNGPSGSLDIYISAAESMQFNSDSYWYDLELYTDQDPYNKLDPEFVTRLLEGIVTIKFNITR